MPNQFHETRQVGHEFPGTPLMLREGRNMRLWNQMLPVNMS